DRRAKLAERPGPAQHRARKDRGPEQRQRDTREHPPAVRAKGTCRFLVAVIERPKSALDRDDEKWHRDEGLGDDGGGCRERYLDAKGLIEDRTDEPAPTEREEERDA